ncbi:hypothetical protein KSP40_PGU012743 [Platanthera guangdongensis]|uniref:Uncharacterized protein n=1 Tax=Platanthera guangdongensis TaxID=2320717 RepID=A0ABR2LLQ7_9ASPA
MESKPTPLANAQPSRQIILFFPTNITAAFLPATVKSCLHNLAGSSSLINDWGTVASGYLHGRLADQGGKPDFDINVQFAIFVYLLFYVAADSREAGTHSSSGGGG